MGFKAAIREDNSAEITTDDSSIFCDADIDQVKHLRVILVIFEVVLGLHVNWSKSMLFPVKEVANIQVLAAIFRCERGHYQLFI